MAELPVSDETNTAGRTLVVACGALVRELRAVVASHDLDHLDVHYLPAPLHNRPERIGNAIEKAIDDSLTPAHDRVLIGYADCGTGGGLDRLLDARRADGLTIERLPGDHCYEFFTGADFAALHESELGTFFVTDYIARHFDQLIWKTFKFDDHPELIEMVFANYTRLVHLSQTDDESVRAELEAAARDAADRLGLRFEARHTGLAPFGSAMVSIAPRTTGTARNRTVPTTPPN